MSTRNRVFLFIAIFVPYLVIGYALYLVGLDINKVIGVAMLGLLITALIVFLGFK
jgi:hypothetical protein